MAAMCDVGKSTVSQWRKRGIPDGWRKYLQMRNPLKPKRKRARKP